MHEMPRYDPEKVEAFLAGYTRATGKIKTSSRMKVLDARIRAGNLSVADKIEAVKRLAPARDFTDPREELRLERLICTLSADQLPGFKFALDYDGDYKDLEEYVFHDIDDERSQERILAHLAEARGSKRIGIKVLSDVDDTIYANLVDDRYPKKTFYPGALELYEAVKKEPFELDWIPVTTLSARPNPVAGTLEEGSLRAIREHTGGRLRPSALSGRVVSSLLGTIETLARDQREEARKNPDHLVANVFTGALDLVIDLERWERKIGQVKFHNFRRYAKVYPEYDFVFFGDSGQADALTAELMITESPSRVGTTFIHDLGDSARSPTFMGLDGSFVITASNTSSPGVILFRNHIQAVVLAYRYCKGLVTSRDVAAVTRAALKEFLWIDFRDRRARSELQSQYRDDAQAALRILEEAPGDGHADDVSAIRARLERSYPPPA